MQTEKDYLGDLGGGEFFQGKNCFGRFIVSMLIQEFPGQKERPTSYNFDVYFKADYSVCKMNMHCSCNMLS